MASVIRKDPDHSVATPSATEGPVSTKLPLAIGPATGQGKPVMCRENVVVLTTLVHPGGRLSNLRHELQLLFDALYVYRRAVNQRHARS